MVTDLLGRYARLIKLKHTLFSLPLLYAGAFIAAGGFPTAWEAFWILVAGTAARAAGFALNRWLDRRVDALNPRTCHREIASGRLNTVQVWAFIAASLAIYVLAAHRLNPLCFELSPIPILVFIAYPYLKHHTEWAHAGIGVSVALAPIAGELAVCGAFQDMSGIWLLGLFTFLWATGFDIIYSTLDEEFDRANGLKSLPAVYGKAHALRAAKVIHVLAFLTLMVLHYVVFYYAAWWLPVLFLGSIAALLVWEHRVAPTNVELAFFWINAAIGILVFLWICVGVSI